MRVFYEGYEYLRTNDIGTMKQWWESRIYQKDGTIEDASHVEEKQEELPASHKIHSRKVSPKKTKDEDPLEGK